ncbi:hypothetical protein FRB93_013818 [Tulasnella sp. JGI-2019a]|nr:hypothetical protein FRB93_013818 [Tulasnella sp. JGI-2019a]
MRMRRWTETTVMRSLRSTIATKGFGPYRVARHPALGYRTAIEISNLTGALDFEAELKAFFKRENPRLGDDNLASIARSQFALYTSFTRNIGSIRGIATEDFVDRVHARPATSAVTAARYDTVLWLESEEAAGEIGLEGYRIGQVRTIFSLPASLHCLRPQASITGTHLAYLELFTPFTPRPEPHSKLFQVSRSVTNTGRRTIVVPLDLIFRSCHLIPKWGKAVDHQWSSTNVLERCKAFYLNSFSDHHMYLFV